MPIYLLPFFVFLINSCTSGLALDKEIGAVEAEDLTALVQGCGNQLVSGYTYCRKMEGEATNESITFVAPISNCKNGECTELKIFYPDGSPSYGYVFKKGESKHVVKWTTLTKKNTFDVQDRGFWLFTYRIKFIDTDGRERETVTEGEIRLRVYRQAYIPLHEVPEDRNYVWKFNFDGVNVRMTTGGRTYVSRKNKGKTLPSNKRT